MRGRGIRRARRGRALRKSTSLRASPSPTLAFGETAGADIRVSLDRPVHATPLLFPAEARQRNGAAMDSSAPDRTSALLCEEDWRRSRCADYAIRVATLAAQLREAEVAPNGADSAEARQAPTALDEALTEWKLLRDGWVHALNATRDEEHTAAIRARSGIPASDNR